MVKFKNKIYICFLNLIPKFIMKTRTLFAAFLLTITSVLFAQQPKAGADKDAHGCIASAGYTYSELKKECIRTFEQKIQLKEIATQGNYTAAVLRLKSS